MWFVISDFLTAVLLDSSRINVSVEGLIHLIVLNISGLILGIVLKYNNISSFLILRRHICRCQH